MSTHHPLSVSNIVAGLLVTIIGGVVVAYLTKERKDDSTETKQTQETVSPKSDLTPKSIPVTKEHPSPTRDYLCIYSTDSLNQQISTNEGKLIFKNESQKDSLRVTLNSFPRNGNTYTLYLQKKDYHNLDQVSIPVGVYFWEVRTDKIVCYGGLVNISSGQVKTITITDIKKRDSS